MSIYETSITNPRKQLEFYKDLSEQLQQESNQLRLINKEHQQINGQLREANKLLNEQYIRLYKEYEQLKDNWNKIKEYLKGFDIEYLNEIMEHNLANTLESILDKMREIEQGSDSNVKD